jgi:hypothetical protein
MLMTIINIIKIFESKKIKPYIGILFFTQIVTLLKLFLKLNISIAHAQ